MIFHETMQKTTELIQLKLFKNLVYTPVSNIGVLSFQSVCRHYHKVSSFQWLYIINLLIM